MQLAQLYEETISRLRDAGIEEAETDAGLLLEFSLGLTRTQLFLEGEKDLTDSEVERFHTILRRRLSREPLHYITGIREFWSLDFIVTPAVLIPRPETEFVLESVLRKIHEQGGLPGTLLDMCTGSGVIAVVLAKELDGAQVVAVDSSIDALQVASRNVQKFDLENKISLVSADLFTAFTGQKLFDVIVANPPYIAENDIQDLQPEVRDWEPRQALTSGVDGMDVIETLVDKAYRYLVPGGWLFVEIGFDQSEKIQDLFASDSDTRYESITVLADWSGRSRLLQARRKGTHNG